jgi:hypothetical protein
MSLVVQNNEAVWSLVPKTEPDEQSEDVCIPLSSIYNYRLCTANTITTPIKLVYWLMFKYFN